MAEEAPHSSVVSPTQRVPDEQRRWNQQSVNESSERLGPHVYDLNAQRDRARREEGDEVPELANLRQMNKRRRTTEFGPFTKWIRDTFPNPDFVFPQFAFPQFALYDGKSSRPQDHICHFKSVMGLITDEEALFCKAFPCTLTDTALTWYATLEPNSIDSWAALEEYFLDRFSIAAGIIPRPRRDLANVKQREGETLLSYLERFKRVYDEIEEISEDAVLTCFEGGLRSVALYTELLLRPPKTLGEMFSTALTVALAEEASETKRGTQKMK